MGERRGDSKKATRTSQSPAGRVSTPAPATPPRKRRPTPARIMAPRLLFIGSVVFLVVVGLVMIYSASSIVALNDTGDPQYYLKRQIVFIAMGAALAVVLAIVPISRWRGFFGYAVWGLLALALLATAVIGVVGGGAQRWISIAGQQVQPSELAKISCILIGASIVLRWVDGNLPTKGMLARIAIYVLLPVLLILRQPDMGTAFITVFGLAILFWLVRIPKRFFLALVVAICAVGVVAILIEPYRISRFVASFNPWSDPLGTGYQSIHALYAYGSGGLFGVGLGNSAQKFLYLPAGYTDFIFAIIGEELGFIGCVVVIAAFGVLVYSGVMIARNSTSRYGQLVATTLTLLIGFQASVNIFQTLGLFPVTGKPLPFISYGGSSLLATMAMVGLILSVSFHTDTSTAADKRRDQLRILSGGPGPAGASRPPKRTPDRPGRRGTGGKAAASPRKPTKVEDIDSLRRGKRKGPDGSSARPITREAPRDPTRAAGQAPRRQRAGSDRSEPDVRSSRLTGSGADRREEDISDSASHIEQAIRSDRRRRLNLRSRDSDSPDDGPPESDG